MSLCQIEEELDWLENQMRSASLDQLPALHVAYEELLAQLMLCTSS